MKFWVFVGLLGVFALEMQAAEPSAAEAREMVRRAVEFQAGREDIIAWNKAMMKNITTVFATCPYNAEQAKTMKKHELPSWHTLSHALLHLKPLPGTEKPFGFSFRTHFDMDMTVGKTLAAGKSPITITDVSDIKLHKTSGQKCLGTFHVRMGKYLAGNCLFEGRKTAGTWQIQKLAFARKGVLAFDDVYWIFDRSEVELTSKLMVKRGLMPHLRWRIRLASCQWPAAGVRFAELPAARIVISIIEGAPMVDDQEVKAGQLAAKVAAAVQRGLNGVVVLRCGRGIKYGTVKPVLKALLAAGIDRVRFAYLIGKQDGVERYGWLRLAKEENNLPTHRISAKGFAQNPTKRTAAKRGGKVGLVLTEDHLPMQRLTYYIDLYSTKDGVDAATLIVE